MRIKAYDIAKGIGILLMVIGHITGMVPIHKFIYQFHMPLFLLLSGMLFNEHKWKSTQLFVVSRIKTILIPYAFFSIIIVWFLIALCGYNDIITILKTGIPHSVWFIIVLFHVEIIFQLFRKIMLKNLLSVILFAAIAFVIGKVLYYNDIVLPYKLSSIPICLFFYTIGFFLNTPPNVCVKKQNYGFFLPHYSSKIICILGIACLLLVYVYVYFTGYHTELAENKINLGGCLTALIGSYGIICISVLIERHFKFSTYVLSWLGQNTLAFIGLNTIFINLNDIYIRPHISMFILYKFVQFMTTVFFCALSSYVLNKYSPWIFGKRKAVI